MSKLFFLPMAALGALFVAYSFGLFSHNKEVTKITITGSSTVAPLMMEISKRYENLHPVYRIDVQTGGSSRGIADVKNNIADIGMVSRNPKLNEQNELHWIPVANDGLAIIVHKTNSLAGLSRQQVIDVYTGKINSWQQLGGPDQGIVVVSKAEGRSTLEVFLKYHGLQNDQIEADVIIGDNQQGIKTVANNKYAIAYVSIGTAEFEAQQGSAIKLLDAEGIKASVANVTKGVYPITRTLHVVTPAADSAKVEKFIRYARSARVNDLIRGQYFVPLIQ